MRTTQQPRRRHYPAPRTRTTHRDANTAVTDRPESCLTPQAGEATPDNEPQPNEQHPITRMLDAGARTCRCGARADSANSRCSKCLDRATWTRRKQIRRKNRSGGKHRASGEQTMPGGES